MSSWTPTENEKYGVAISNYHGDIEHGLLLSIGDAVQIYEQCSGWYHGCLLRNRSQKGIFPASYIFIKECEVEHAGTAYEVIIPEEDVTVKELSSVLREWSIIWKRLYLRREFQLFVALTKIMKDLIEFRQQLLNGTLTKDQAFETKQKAIIDIDWANSKMGLDLIPRINGEVLDGDNVVSVVELYNVHVESAKASESGLGTFKKVKKHPVKTMTNRMLYLTVNGLMCNVEENCQVFFSLYDASKGEFISERYMVSVGKSDSNQKVDQLQKFTNATCVFMDLGESVMYSNCYLVAQLVRIGKMLSESSSKKVSNMSFRRPYGCAAVDIVDILKDYDEIEDSELIMPIQLIGGSSDTDYITMHESIIKKLQSKYGVPDSNMNIQISVRMLHGDFDKLQRENPLLFPKETAIVRRLGFPDIIMPGDVRNDVYVTLERGEFERGSGKTAQRNVEVSMVVLGASGRVLEDVIYPAGGSRPCSEYNSMIYYHNGNPKWNETVKVKVPFEKFYGSIIRFGFRHLAKYEEKDKESKTFAFAFLHLMREDGTTVRDGSHELIVYKFEKNTFYDSKAFTTLPSMQSQLGTLKNSTIERVPRTREAFYVRTVACSTKLTQNVHLVGLLRWREQKHQLQSVLESLIKIDGEEIVKFLQDIFDALFWILNDSAEEYGSLVFQAIVFIICILSDKKYQHFQAVLTTYIEKHFSGTTAHKKLVSCLKQTLEQTGDTNSIERLKKTLMALEYVFKFIFQSRVLYINTFGNKDEDKFRSDLVSLFMAMNNVMNQRSGDIVPAQSLLLRNFSGIYKDTLKLLTRVELGNVIKEFINSVGKDSKSKALICPKLQCILQTVQSELFIHEDSRKVLLPVIVSHIHFHLSQKQEMKTCAGILGPVLTVLQTKALGSKDEDIYLVVKSLLQTLFLIVRILDRAGTLSRHLLAILINLLRIMTEDHYCRFLEEFDNKKELRDFLFNTFVVFTEMIKRHIFPDDWVVIIMLANNVILTAVQNFSVALCDNFCEDNFDLQLWNNYFQLSVAFLIQPHLQLENFTEVKRNKIVDRYGDMRQVMGFEIGDMWQNLGEHKKNFIPSLIGPFLEMTLVPETELRKATLPIFFDMIESELLSKGFIQTVENEIVNKLDTLVNYNKKADGHHNRKEGPLYKKKGDEEYKELFHDILTEKVEEKLNGELKEEGLGFVNRITELLELLLDYRSCRAENNLLRRLHCIVNLLEFYRGIYREDMYIRYINRLCELHIPAENYTEAGFTLLLHADLLNWDEQPLSETKTSITERQLKEKLYLDAIEYFDKGKCWEKGIELCKELATLYEEEMYDFIKLRDILKNEALLYDQIMTKVRPDAEYFRVAMYGRGFPTSLRDKVFIFRGNEFEKMGEFNSRLQGHFPDAQFMDKLDAPDDSVLQSPGQYIQTCKVNPVFECEDRFRDRHVDERIIGYFRTNSVRSFTYNRPFHRGSKINEFADLWLERTTMTIASPLPGILKWFPVTSTSTEEISPIRNAIETVEQKNRQIRSLVSLLSTEPNQNINPLSMTLNGVIDAAVMGGTAKYQEAFFSDGYLLSNPQDELYVNELHQVILLQVQILEEGLELHQRLLTRPLVPFHEKMALQFARMKADVTGEAYEEPQPILIPATPEEKKVDRKLSLTPRKASTSSRESQSRNSMFYDSATSSPITPSPNASLSKRTFSSSLTSLNSSASRGSFPSFGGSMTSLNGSVLSLNTVKEEDGDEAPPPVPLKNRPPSDPDQRSLNGVPIIPHDHGRKSLPASVMSSWLARVDGSPQLPKKEQSASPPLPRKERDMSPPLPRKERSGSSLLTSGIDDLPGMPPPLPPRQSAHYRSTSSIYSSSDDELETPKTSPVPALPPKTRNSIHHDNQTDSKPNPLRDDYDFPIPHPNPGFSDVNSPDSDTVSVFSSSSRDSITTPDELLTPVPSDISPTPTLPSKKFVYPTNNNISGSPPEDTPPPLQPRVKHTIQANSEELESTNKPVEEFFSKFRKDLNDFGNEQFPLSAPTSSWSVKTTKTVTKTTVVNGKTVSSTSSETSHSTSGRGTSTLRPNSLLTSEQSLNALMDEIGSSLGRQLISPAKVSKPVPVPRKMSGDRKSIGTSPLTKRDSIVEDEEERTTRPSVKPRARTPSNKDTPEAPPKPPKQYSST